MNHIKVYLKKKQREEVLKQYPNLTSKVNVVVLEFDTDTNFRKAKPSQVKKFVENALEEKSLVNTDYDYNSVEDAIVVQNYNMEKPVYEGEIRMPDTVVQVSEDYSGEGRLEVRN